MKSDRRTHNGKKNFRLFFAVLGSVLGVGFLGMLLYAGWQEKMQQAEQENGTQMVFSEDIFGHFTEIFQGETSKEVLGEDQKQEEIRQEESILQEALEHGEKASIIECASEDTVTLLFAGDILFDEKYAVMANLLQRGGAIETAFSADLLEVMHGADVFMVNNEFTFTDRGTPTEGKQFTFRAQPQKVHYLQDMGVDVVSVANNHIYDYGEISLLDTLDTLNGAGIPYTGAGKNLEEAMQPVYLIANGMKIGVIAATQIERNGTPDTKEATENSAGVLRCMNPENLLQTIAEMEERCDYTILYIHWGTESQEEIDWLQEEQVGMYAESGVDLIIGDHPHCLQKIDVVSGVPVIYSLGNFWFNSKTQNSCVVEVSLQDKKLQSFRFLPCKQEDSRTRLLNGTEKQGVLNYMRGISQNVLIDEEGYVSFG